jgi:hypothetical protein
MEKHGVEHVPRMENDREIHIGWHWLAGCYEPVSSLRRLFIAYDILRWNEKYRAIWKFLNFHNDTHNDDVEPEMLRYLGYKDLLGDVTMKKSLLR